MPEVLPGDSLSAESLQQFRPDKYNNASGTWNTHAEDGVQVMDNGRAQDLYGYLAPFVFSP